MPFYMTQYDSGRENRVIDAIKADLKRFGVKGAEFVNRSNTEFVRWEIWHKGRKAVLLVVKCRSCSQHAYENYKLSKEKIDAAIEKASEAKLPLYLVVCWTNGTFGKELREPPKRIGTISRTDRNDKKDTEPAYIWDYDEFNLYLDIRANFQQPALTEMD